MPSRRAHRRHQCAGPPAHQRVVARRGHRLAHAPRARTRAPRRHTRSRTSTRPSPPAATNGNRPSEAYQVDARSRSAARSVSTIVIAVVAIARPGRLSDRRRSFSTRPAGRSCRWLRELHAIAVGVGCERLSDLGVADGAGIGDLDAGVPQPTDHAFQRPRLGTRRAGRDRSARRLRSDGSGGRCRRRATLRRSRSRAAAPRRAQHVSVEPQRSVRRRSR